MSFRRPFRLLWLPLLWLPLLALPCLPAGGDARAEVVRKVPPPAKPPAGPAGELAAKIVPAGPEDARRLEALRLRLGEWEARRAHLRRRGLELSALLVPDALAWRVARGYLAQRAGARGHEAAVKAVAPSLARWKRLRGRALLLVEVRNLEARRAGRDPVVYTLEKDLAAGGISFTDARRRRLPLALAGQPAGLRVARLRVKKFWVTADGRTRLVRPPGDRDRADPASIGRDPLLSRPFSAIVLEEKPAKIDLLLSRRALSSTRSHAFGLRLPQWKRYEGPFEKDVLDLNADRPWAPIEPPALRVELPPAGLDVAPELEALVEAVEKAARTHP